MKKNSINIEDFVEEILDLQNNIILITDGNKIYYTNVNFFKFFNEYETLKEFHKKHISISDFFEKIENSEYLYEGKSGLSWIEYMQKHKKKTYKTIIKKENKLHIFEIQFNELDEFDKYVIILTDVTEIENTKNQLQNRIEKVYELSTTDMLTKAYNRLHFNNFIEEEIEVAKRYGNPLSLTMFDIDHFKRVNDTYGHLVGDSVLIEISKIVRYKIRGADMFFRYGGEEFVILFLNTNMEGAIKATENLRELIDEFDFANAGHVTCSFGVAEYKNSEDIKDFIRRTDEALYVAKKSGRNRVEIAN